MPKYKPKPHDLGGQPIDQAIQIETHAPADWELDIDGIASVLRAKGFIFTDELRRSIENLDPSQYLALQYYERWCTAIENLLIEKQLISAQDIQKELDLL